MQNAGGSEEDESEPQRVDPGDGSCGSGTLRQTRREEGDDRHQHGKAARGMAA